MKRQAIWILGISVLACTAMALVDILWPLGYVTRAGIKILLLSGGMLLYRCVIGERGLLRRLFAPQGLGLALLLGVGVFGVVLGAYFLFRSFIDLDGIAAGLLANAQVSADNFLWVALYISVVNSLLEELFFRGFGYLTLRRHWDERLAGIFSAAAFALYHVSIIRGWFSWWIYGLCMAGLFIGGLLFNALDRRGSIYPSWLVHGAANLAINTIGLMMFGMV